MKKINQPGENDWRHLLDSPFLCSFPIWPCSGFVSRIWLLFSWFYPYIIRNCSSSSFAPLSYSMEEATWVSFSFFLFGLSMATIQTRYRRIEIDGNKENKTSRSTICSYTSSGSSSRWSFICSFHLCKTEINNLKKD